jgi:hypothetical protein
MKPDSPLKKQSPLWVQHCRVVSKLSAYLWDSSLSRFLHNSVLLGSSWSTGSREKITDFPIPLSNPVGYKSGRKDLESIVFKIETG